MTFNKRKTRRRLILPDSRGDRFVLEEVGGMDIGEFAVECMCNPRSPLIGRYLDLISLGYGSLQEYVLSYSA